ncbi:MAG: NAD(P)-dependent oxidoreductase, partial [Pseudomonadota bacterium]
MKIAVTGASGFIGSNLTSHLLKKGHSVVAISRTALQIEDPNLQSEAADVRDPEALARVFEGCDAVIHLAALFNNPECSHQEYRDINVGGT